MQSVTFTMELPDDLTQRLLEAGPVVWGHTGPKFDVDHIADFTDTLRKTKEYFGTTDDATDLQGVYLDGTEIVVAHTGTSPNSAAHARLIVGLWNALHDVAKQALSVAA